MIAEAPPASVNLVPIPIRDDMNAMLQIPFDLTKAEAEKISRVVLALAVGELTDSIEGDGGSRR